MLPHTRGAIDLATRAKRFGKEVLLHQPMEALPSRWALRESGTLLASMQAHTFTRTFEAALDRLPNVSGVSNHTGSLLTSDPTAMHRLMAVIKARNLYPDNRTTPAPVALDMAIEAGIPASKRDVFLDNEISLEAIHRAFGQALSVARKQGKPIVIAHPYEQTVRYLEHVLCALPDDITLVSAGYLAYSSYPETPVPQQLAAFPHTVHDQ
ncbi:MAG: divergent polysaccharide deacetylase family protein [Gammaproteobacteria bacterium]|nr:divergent polysaccharide deacetylase family protein [Gammaproteobacteria bacterium]